jgi:hypothetical protein
VSHLVNANKMVSDTPRTDAARPPYTELQEFVSAEFARTLERELNAANELIVRLQAVTNDPHALWANWLRGSVALPAGIGDVREYQERIKRLEEALESIREYWNRDNNNRAMIDACWYAIDRASEALEAKEAKL